MGDGAQSNGPAAPRQYACRLTASLAGLLGPALSAAYLHGSAALGGWVAARSDVDLLFVVADEITSDAVTAAGDLLTEWAGASPGRGLECSVVTAGQAVRPTPPWPFVLHVAVGEHGPAVHLGELVPGDPDLLIHYAVCRAAGLTLAGPPPAEGIGPVARPVILAYLAGDLAWGLANAPESYCVLNACRALVFLHEDRIVSKIDGAQAALDRGLGPSHLIRRALDQQRGHVPEQPPAPDAVWFVRGAAGALRAAVTRMDDNQATSISE